MNRMDLVDKYRPRKLDDVIGQSEIRLRIRNYIDRKKMTPLLFVGPPGCGKTSMAEVVSRERYGKGWVDKHIELNASDDRGIKVVRERIKTTARVLNEKVIFLTEADNMTTDAQQALRRIIEKYKTYTIFILDCNYPDRIIQPIRSRCAEMWFEPIGDNEILRFIVQVLLKEKIKLPYIVKTMGKTKKRIIDPKCQKALKKLVSMSRGDLRYAMNQLETLITKDLELTYKNVLSLNPADEAPIIFNKAISGDLQGSIELLEDYLIQKNYHWEILFKSWYEMLIEYPNGEDNEQNKANKKELAYNLMYNMAMFEDRCRRGNVPLYQLSAFLAYVWRAPNLQEA